jgi:hypothetical protein
LSGLTMDDLVGTLAIDNLSLYDDNFIYNPGSIYLQATDSSSTSEKEIRLTSSFLEAEISGDYRFSTIGSEFITALHCHLPSVIQSPDLCRFTTWNRLLLPEWWIWLGKIPFNWMLICPD